MRDSSRYEPSVLEERWNDRWASARINEADPARPGPPFCLAITPPSVTSVLHMGHALQAVVQDVAARHRRMTGHSVLWLPGTDHAAIGTQFAIEQDLGRRGLTKEEIGRDAWDAEVREWYGRNSGIMLDQLVALGASIDTSRVRFTADQRYEHAVRTAFVEFWDRGWVYRDEQVLNWCTARCGSVSDMEVHWQDIDGPRYVVEWQVEGLPGRTVATPLARPELLPTVAAVVLHPDAEWDDEMVGRRVVIPELALSVPVLREARLRRRGGRQAVPLMPAHNAEHWELARRHGLMAPCGLDERGRVVAPALGSLDGLAPVEARTQVLEMLAGRCSVTDRGPNPVARCARCSATVEQRPVMQWFLRMGEMAEAAAKATQDREVVWYPPRVERDFLEWLGGMRDWCVSRQLWLGHRLPVYTCADGHTWAEVEPATRCRTCSSTSWEQDPDVLDAWFSSALWPFAALGWPQQSADLARFYPNQATVASKDILKFGISRMIMAGLALTDQVPFREVILAGVVLAPDGRKMRAALGNAVDPVEAAREHGADALRTWAAWAATTGEHVRYDETRIAGYRSMANKLWNLVLLHAPDAGSPAASAPQPSETRSLADRCIMTQLKLVIDEVTEALDSYRFHHAVDALQGYVLREFGAWYTEWHKAGLRAQGDRAAAGGLHVLEVLLPLIHPFMPFLTEELWHRLPGDRDLLARAAWPRADELAVDQAAVADVRQVLAIARETRAVRQQVGPAAATGAGLWLTGALDGPSRELLVALTRVDLLDEKPLSGLPLPSGAGWLRAPHTSGAA